MIKLSKYVLKYWYAYVIALICMAIQVILDMMSPQITKSIIDDVIGAGQNDILPKLLLMILLIGIGRCFFGYIKEFTFDRIGCHIGMKMRKHLFHHIQGLSVNFFDKTNTGEIMSRVKDDVDRIQNAVGFIGMLVVEVTMHTVIILYCMFQLDKTLFLIPIIAMPICGVMAFFLERKLDTVFEEISEQNATLNSVAQENLAGVRTVKAFAREKYEIKKFLSHNKRYYDLNMKQSKLWVRFNPIFQLISKFLPILSIIVGGYMVVNEQISLGTLGAFIMYCNNIVWPMEMLGWLSNEFAAGFASNKRLKKIYEEKPIIVEKSMPKVLDQVFGHVTFDHVSLAIDGKPILENISFDLPAGKTIGIMGATGTGKTSIINLLMRFYDVNEGCIKLDNIDIREMELSQLRQSTSLVMQDVFLFSDTIHENVKLGKKKHLNREEVISALEKSQAADFIVRMEHDYETIIGERGVGLSGGQKQRISIARALAKKSPILILDDSTSALDMETEHMIQQELNDLSHITKIVIAHRISAVRNADEIIILDQGKIIERGTHDSLLNQKGYYYDTYMAQYGEFLGVIA